MADAGTSKRRSWVGWLWILSGVLLIGSAIAYALAAVTEGAGVRYVLLALVGGAAGVANLVIGIRQRREAGTR